MATEEEAEDFIAHFGVKGMKWGVRRGSLGSRLTGSLSEKNSHRINKSSTKLSRAKSIGKGETFVNRQRAKKISTLTDQNKRIAAGKATAKDILIGLNKVSLTNLAVTTTRTATRDKRDTKVTRQVKDDFKNISNKDFRSKYATTKGVYERRVMAKGDPYAKNSARKINQ